MRIRISDNAKSPLDFLFTVPYSRNPHYFPRPPLGYEIYRKLYMGGARIVLVGPAGIGYRISIQDLPHV
jgi:hypothetical protein